MRALSLTPYLSGVFKPAWIGNRFSGFWRRVETAKAVETLLPRQVTPLERGVNETERFKHGHLRRQKFQDRHQTRVEAGISKQALSEAFSLIELLVTVAIILILTTLYFGPNTANRQQALKRACQKNLEKIYVSMEIYANEHGGRFPEISGARTSEEALDVLVPKYTSDTSPFICPGSSDGALPAGESFRSRKISYAYYMGRSVTNSQQVLMSDKQVDATAKSVGQAVFSTTGKPPGSNHRRFGGNFLFCDGHTEMSSAMAQFPLALTNGEVLLNP
jgi:prepilin-type N-terminal cleavage/methylation domain-containing protein/prepilin-type processing-associated H-X9-DG protein